MTERALMAHSTLEQRGSIHLGQLGQSTYLLSTKPTLTLTPCAKYSLHASPISHFSHPSAKLRITQAISPLAPVAPSTRFDAIVIAINKVAIV